MIKELEKIIERQNQRWILKKKLFCLAALPKSLMVATNLAPNFDFEFFF